MLRGLCNMAENNYEPRKNNTGTKGALYYRWARNSKITKRNDCNPDGLQRSERFP